MDLEARLRALREPKSRTPPAAAPPPPVPPVSRPVSSAPRPNFATFASPPKTKATVAAPIALPPPPPVDIANLLGPEYEAAVQQAQYAIECERQRLVHTAIDTYISAGQALVAIGRRQTVPHLQTILKTKALALLQRAEGLEEWANRIIASNAAHAKATEETLRLAVAESQLREQRDADEKEVLVTQMKNENSELEQKLNQLVLLAKVQTRFRRMVSDRRARKAKEAGHSSDQSSDQEAHDAGQVNGAATTTTTPESSSPREEQRRALVNELHSRIGLPEINTWHTFKPLSESADHDQRRDRLAKELEDARQEADRLRSAVQEMERALRVTAEHSREQSLKLEQQKEADVARLQSELERMKNELDLERRMSSKRMSSGDPDAFENDDIIEKLRLSLRAYSNDDDDEDDDDDDDDDYDDARRAAQDPRTTRVRRLSMDHSSPRHQPRAAADQAKEGSADGDDDDGMWV